MKYNYSDNSAGFKVWMSAKELLERLKVGYLPRSNSWIDNHESTISPTQTHTKTATREANKIS